MNLVRLTEASVDEAGEVFARAFQEDPFQSYIIPDPEERRRLSPPFFSELVRYGVVAGEVWATNECIKGLAVWLPPDHRNVHVDLLEETGFSRLPSIIGEEAFGRFKSFMDYIAPLRSRAVPGPHWYTMGLGVDPKRQREGVGRSLLHEIFPRADAEGAPCYLETTQLSNVQFYINSGFEVVDHAIEPKSGLQYWTFRRNPRGRSTSR
jgi:GNAT superfamily N-acetyltransferase